MKNKMSMIVALALATSTQAFAATSVVEGKIAKVVESKTEIYVSDKEGKKHEYYFNKETQILKNGQPAEFAQLEVGQPVRVTAEKTGKRLDPKKVEILE